MPPLPPAHRRRAAHWAFARRTRTPYLPGCYLHLACPDTCLCRGFWRRVRTVRCGLCLRRHRGAPATRGAAFTAGLDAVLRRHAFRRRTPARFPYRVALPAWTADSYSSYSVWACLLSRLPGMFEHAWEEEPTTQYHSWRIETLRGGTALPSSHRGVWTRKTSWCAFAYTGWAEAGVSRPRYNPSHRTEAIHERDLPRLPHYLGSSAFTRRPTLPCLHTTRQHALCASRTLKYELSFL